MIHIEKNVPLAAMTSYKIGGPASHYVAPRDDDEVAEAYKFACDNGLDALVLGCGSNLLVSDSGVNALVINLSHNKNDVREDIIKWDGATVTVSAGCSLNALTLAAVERGVSGIESLCGIPGTVGGAITMNAGAFGTEICDTVKSVKVFNKKSFAIETLDKHELNFGYRTSVIKDGNYIVLSATLELKNSDANLLRETRNNILEKRRAKQPLDLPNCGSVFKRPKNNFAGTLIESCGLKGFKIGAAQISEKHANFIVNLGGATAEDVKKVIDHARKVVFEKHNVLLEPEVIFWGEFEKQLYTIIHYVKEGNNHELPKIYHRPDRD